MKNVEDLTQMSHDELMNEQKNRKNQFYHYCRNNGCNDWCISNEFFCRKLIYFFNFPIVFSSCNDEESTCICRG